MPIDPPSSCDNYPKPYDCEVQLNNGQSIVYTNILVKLRAEGFVQFIISQDESHFINSDKIFKIKKTSVA